MIYLFMEKNKKNHYPLRDIPQDVFKIIIREQARLKDHKGTAQFGISQTIYSIVREWDRCKEK